MTEIAGKTVLITGGAGGLGVCLARTLAEAGARQIVLWDYDREALNRARDTLAGASIIVQPLDVSDGRARQEALATLAAQDVRIEILINNAAILVPKLFMDHSAADIDRSLEINVLAPMHLTQALLPGMISRGAGHVVNVASAAGLVTNPELSVYVASKWALTGWSDSLRIEMSRGRTAVVVTTIAPYYLRTKMSEAVDSPVLPLTDPEDAAIEILDAIRRNKRYRRFPWQVRMLPFIRGILPARLFDTVVGDWMGVYSALTHVKPPPTGADEPKP